MVITMTSEKEKADENVLVVLPLSRGQEPTQYTIYKRRYFFSRNKSRRKSKGTYCPHISYLISPNVACSNAVNLLYLSTFYMHGPQIQYSYDRSRPICQKFRSSLTTSCQIYVNLSNRSGEGRSAATLLSKFSAH